MQGSLELNKSAEQKLTVIYDKKTSVKVKHFQERMYLEAKLPCTTIVQVVTPRR